MLYKVAQAPNAFLGVLRWFGTDAEAGEFEAVFIGITETTRGERQVGTELFEVDEMAAAQARFEALCSERGSYATR